MTNHRIPIAFVMACYFTAAVPGFGQPGAGEASNRRQYAQAGQKAGELERVRDELAKAREEIERLRRENARLKNALGQTRAPAALPVAPASPGTIQPALAAHLPPRNLEETIPVQDLVNQFKSNPMQSEATYKNQTFRIQGVVGRFQKSWVGHTYTVDLKGSDPFTAVKCQVRFPGLSDFAESQDGKTLSGSRPFKKLDVLLQAGQPLTLEGTCSGLRDAALEFTKCRLVN